MIVKHWLLIDHFDKNNNIEIIGTKMFEKNITMPYFSNMGNSLFEH